MNCCHQGISGFGHATDCYVRFGRVGGREWDDDDFVSSEDENDSRDEETENDCDD